MNCPCCGQDHGVAGVLPGEPGNVVEGINILICPRLPEDWVYVSQSYERGPGGMIIDVSTLQSQRRPYDQHG